MSVLHNAYFSTNVGNLVSSLQLLRREEKLCDVVLICDGQRFPAHRNVLAANCRFFYAMFVEENLLESQQREVVIHDLAPHHMADLLDFLYNTRNPIHESNALDLLFLADKLGVDSLKAASSVFVEEHMTADSAVAIFRAALLTGNYAMQAVAAKLIGMYLGELVSSPDFRDLDFDTVRSLLQHDDLAVRTEYTVWTAVAEWLSEHMSDAECSQENAFLQLLDLVRYPMMSAEELCRVRQHPLLKSNSVARHHVEHSLLVAYESLFLPDQTLQQDMDVEDDRAAQSDEFVSGSVANGIGSSQASSAPVRRSRHRRSQYGPQASDIVLQRALSDSRMVFLIRMHGISTWADTVSQTPGSTGYASSEFRVDDSYFSLRVAVTTIDMRPFTTPSTMHGFMIDATTNHSVTASAMEPYRVLSPALAIGRSNARPMSDRLRTGVSYEVVLLNRMDHRRDLVSRVVRGTADPQATAFQASENSLELLRDRSRGYVWDDDSFVFRVTVELHRQSGTSGLFKVPVL